MVGHTLIYTVFKSMSIRPTVSEIQLFLYPPPCFADLTIIWPSRSRKIALEPTPQQLITQSAQATADAIASALTARTVSISLPIYDWDSKDTYHSFSILIYPGEMAPSQLHHA